MIPCRKEWKPAKKEESQEDESVLSGFASQGAASSGSRLSERGDREALRGVESDDQALLETAARDGNRGSESHSRTAATVSIILIPTFSIRHM